MNASVNGAGMPLIGIIAIALSVAGLIAAFIWLARIQATRKKELLNKFEGKNILKIASNANFFGQQSMGYSQIRGNGVLLLTADELYFEMLIPKRSFSIRISSILSIETPRSFLGKSKGRKLLKVVFKDENQKEDSMAWMVVDLAGWQEKLESILNESPR